MKIELEQRIASDFPFMRRVNRNGDTDAIGIFIDDGWYKLLNELCEKIAAVYRDSGVEPDIIVDEVKEKYGGMRFEYHFDTQTPTELTKSVHKAIDDLALQYENLSETICEECGDPGKLREELPWILTLCDKCLLAHKSR